MELPRVDSVGGPGLRRIDVEFLAVVPASRSRTSLKPRTRPKECFLELK